MDKLETEKLIYRWRVRAGFLVVILVLALARPSWKTLILSAALGIPGLLIRLWASGHLKKEKELAVSGPYKYTRNPLYLGNFILVAAIVLAAWSWLVLALVILYLAVFYPVIIQCEDKRMMKLFPAEYRAYKEKVPAFFPSLKPYRPSKPARFSWQLYRKNKEFRALAGTLFFWVLILAKMLLFPY